MQTHLAHLVIHHHLHERLVQVLKVGSLIPQLTLLALIRLVIRLVVGLLRLGRPVRKLPLPPVRLLLGSHPITFEYPYRLIKRGILFRRTTKPELTLRGDVSRECVIRTGERESVWRLVSPRTWT